MIVLFGCTSINSKAALPAKAATKTYFVDISNGRVLEGPKTLQQGDILSQDDKDEIMISSALRAYDIYRGKMVNEKEEHGLRVSSKAPYQGTEVAIVGDRGKQYASKCSVGTGIYVVNLDMLLQEGSSERRLDNGVLNTLDDIIEGRDKLVLDFAENTNTYIIKVKYSDMPVVVYYDVDNSRTVTFETGYEFEDNGIKYRVIDPSGKVSAIGLTKKSGKIIIPGAVDMAGYKMKVTDIAKDFMKGDKKVTKVTIGANVTSIGKQAFYKCKKLKKVTIKSKKLKTVGKKAFGKNAKKFSVKMPKKSRKAYKKLFKKAKVRI